MRRPSHVRQWVADLPHCRDRESERSQALVGDDERALLPDLLKSARDEIDGAGSGLNARWKRELMNRHRGFLIQTQNQIISKYLSSSQSLTARPNCRHSQ